MSELSYNSYSPDRYRTTPTVLVEYHPTRNSAPLAALMDGSHAHGGANGRAFELLAPTARFAEVSRCARRSNQRFDLLTTGSIH